MARGLKFASAGRAAAAGDFFRKEISGWGGVPEEMALAENILKFIFKVGDEDRAQ